MISMRTYAEAGVDVAAVRRMQRYINWLIRRTRTSASHPLLGHYAGLFRCGGRTLALHTDGVGTKVLVAQHVGRYDTIGIDAVAMNVNDIACVGARPLALVDYIALQREDFGLVKQLMRGLVKGAREAGTAIVGGETAVMGDVIRGLPGRTGFDLAATAVGVADEVITGAAMRPGDALIGLASAGIHSNGLTLARRVLDLEEWGRELLRPTRIYARPVARLLAECSVRGLAHITGGAFSKLARIGRQAGVGFVLDGMPEPPQLFEAIRSASGADDREMHRTFNMGVGMVAVVPKNEAEEAVRACKKSGVRASVIGSVARGREIILVKKGKRIRLD
ncbi:MAG: phosphoribosylformylglycinamidine cyclo-ligase [Candidatus Micrarchaeia archaeon]